MDSDWELRDHWIPADEAPERINRSRRTIYRWIADGQIRTLRPGRSLWLNVPDLIRVDREKIRRIHGESR